MGVKFSHQKNPLVISVTPREPVAPRDSVGREAVVTREPIKSSAPLVHTASRSSLFSNSSASSFAKGKQLQRRVSFDLLAEMAYAFPEQPLSPVLVELSDSVEEDGDICDGSSSLSGSESGENAGGDGGAVGVGEGGGGRGKDGGMTGDRVSAKQNVMCVFSLTASCPVVFLGQCQSLYTPRSLVARLYYTSLVLSTVRASILIQGYA